MLGKLGVVVHTHNPSTLDAEAEFLIPGKPGLHRQTLSQKRKEMLAEEMYLWPSSQDFALICEFCLLIATQSFKDHLSSWFLGHSVGAWDPSDTSQVVAVWAGGSTREEVPLTVRGLDSYLPLPLAGHDETLDSHFPFLHPFPSSAKEPAELPVSMLSSGSNCLTAAQPMPHPRSSPIARSVGQMVQHSC